MKMKWKKLDDLAEEGSFNLQKHTRSSDKMPLISTNSHDSKSIYTSGLKKKAGTHENQRDVRISG